MHASLGSLRSRASHPFLRDRAARFVLRSFALFAVAICAFSSTSEAAESTATVALGEVSVADLRAHVNAADVRVLAASAMDHTAWPSNLKRATLVSVSVVSMESTRVEEGSSLSCVVSATLRDRKTGNVYALVESRARKEQKTVTGRG